MPPADFVWKYGRGDATVSVREYLRKRASIFGIVRRGTWKETFKASFQYNRYHVGLALNSYLEETREHWEPQVRQYQEEAERLRIEAKKRAEAEALAAAVARVEAEARARLEAMRATAGEHAASPDDSKENEMPPEEAQSVLPHEEPAPMQSVLVEQPAENAAHTPPASPDDISHVQVQP